MKRTVIILMLTLMSITEFELMLKNKIKENHKQFLIEYVDKIIELKIKLKNEVKNDSKRKS